MIKKLILLIGLSSAISACAINQTQQALSVITSAANIRYYYETGEVVSFLDQVELTDVELTTVIEALDTIDKSKATLNSFKGDPQRVIRELPVIIHEYSKIKTAYLSVRHIVQKHYNEYTPQAQASFVYFDTSAKLLDDQFNLLVSSVESNAALMTALSLADTAVKLAAVM